MLSVIAGPHIFHVHITIQQSMQKPFLELACTAFQAGDTQPQVQRNISLASHIGILIAALTVIHLSLRFSALWMSRRSTIEIGDGFDGHPCESSVEEFKAQIILRLYDSPAQVSHTMAGNFYC